LNEEPNMTTSAWKNQWLTDVRVRERNVKKGLLDGKDVEAYLADLADGADKAEDVDIPQPALDLPEVDEDDFDDEDDEDESDDEGAADSSEG
jgi:hypothetical protein